MGQEGLEPSHLDFTVRVSLPIKLLPHNSRRWSKFHPSALLVFPSRQIKRKEVTKWKLICGSASWDRTTNLAIISRALCQLSQCTVAGDGWIEQPIAESKSVALPLGESPSHGNNPWFIIAFLCIFVKPCGNIKHSINSSTKGRNMYLLFLCKHEILLAMSRHIF